MAFVDGAELVIHNAPFDVGFINSELGLLSGDYKNKYKVLTHYCSVIDTLTMARQKHPGQKNNLDALCKRYMVDNSQRDLHGALLDAEILADVYLMMTGGQTALSLSNATSESNNNTDVGVIRRLDTSLTIPVVKASEEELRAHQKKLQTIDKASSGQCFWLKNATGNEP